MRISKQQVKEILEEDKDSSSWRDVKQRQKDCSNIVNTRVVIALSQHVVHLNAKSLTPSWEPGSLGC